MEGRGIFITFEGGDGSGKSTQIRKLMKYLEGKGYSVVLTREPGGTPIGEKIRDIILDKKNFEMVPMAEAMLYAASRAQHVEEVIKPALAAGSVVICDRFIDSSLAYQGYARGLGKSVEVINEYALDGIMPDLTFLMKIDPGRGKKRIGGREADRIETEALSFHQKVFDGYEELERNSDGRIVGIDATGKVNDISKEIIIAFEEYINGRGQL